MNSFLIADDHFIVRAGVRVLINEDFDHAKIDECRDGDSAWKKILACEYDLAILDISMPSTDFLHLLKNIFTHRPGQKILILTMSSEFIYAKKYLSLNPSVKGFINKEADPWEIRTAIASTLNNKRYLRQRMQVPLPEEDVRNLFDSMSIRELEVMNHLVSGKNITEIARMLSVHISTICTHKGKIMQKLKVSNVIELTKMVERFY